MNEQYRKHVRHGVERNLILPAWAGKIRVRRNGNNLQLLGFGVASDAITVTLSQRKRLRDVLALYLSTSGIRTDGSSSRPVHLQFRSSRDELQLVDFVTKNGPVLAKEASSDPAMRNGRASAIQSLAVLRREQQIYAAVFDLVHHLNGFPHSSELKKIDSVRDELRAKAKEIKKSWKQHQEENSFETENELDILGRQLNLVIDKLQNNYSRVNPYFLTLLSLLTDFWKHYRSKKTAGDPPERVIPYIWLGSGLDYSNFVMGSWGAADFSGILWFAHRTVCAVLNNFPASLFYEDGQLHEIPDHTPYGIRPLLYWLLRQDYVRKRLARICKRPGCHQVFTITRRDREYCSWKCVHAEAERQSYARRRSWKM